MASRSSGRRSEETFFPLVPRHPHRQRPLSLPPSPPAPSDADLARYADILSANLAEAQRAMEQLTERDITERSEDYVRLQIRLDTVRAEYQRLISIQERRRLDAMKREALGGDYD